jgi:hypothetical protein
LSAQHHIPVGRIVEILADVAGIEVSAGWVTDACKRVGRSAPRTRPSRMVATPET